uniref:Nonfunctional nonstructural protein 3c n=1 Tax=Canine coronavirus TaxID=11153 RepID=G8A503_9ALPC|nr:nonfunctional nonstructural protein 3c [Canine coronavirus]
MIGGLFLISSFVP